MAVRYSGNVELRIRLVRMRGWDGKMGWFFKAHLRAPKYHGEGILSLREAGVASAADAKTSEGWDKAARAFLDLAAEDAHGGYGHWIEKNAVREKSLRGLFGRWEILRVQQAPCPLEAELEVRRRRGPGRPR